MWCFPRFYTETIDFSFFIDEKNLFCSYDNIRTIFGTANQELNQVNDWLLANKLSLKVQKTRWKQQLIYINKHSSCTSFSSKTIRLTDLDINSKKMYWTCFVKQFTSSAKIQINKIHNILS